MKHLFLCILFLLPICLVAQTRVGIAGGGSFSNKDQGVIGGLMVQKDLGDFSSINLSINYIEKPTSLTILNDNPEQELIRPRIQYFSIPIQYQYHFSVQQVRLGLYGGPYLAYGFKGTLYDKQKELRVDIDFEEMGLHRLDYGLQLGAGIELDLLDNKRMFVKGCYELGLRDLDQKAAYTFSEGWVFLMGFLVPVGQ